MISRKDILVKNMHAFEEKHRILRQANDFIFFLPHPGLREYISSYTVTFPTNENIPDSYTIMPDKGAMLFIEDDRKGLSATLYGAAAKPSVIDNLTGMLVIIMFQPVGLYALTGINQNELTSKIVPFDAVSPILCKLIFEAIEKAGSVYDLMTSLDILLLTNMKKAYPSQLKFAIINTINCAGNTTVKKLSNDIYYSERQLNRIFEQYVGVNVKSLLRLVRVDNAYQLLENNYDTITTISDTLGFYNLPHFIQDFKSLCGMTPQEYRNIMSDFYSERADHL